MSQPPGALRVFGSVASLRAELRKRLKRAEVDVGGQVEMASVEIGKLPPFDPGQKGLAAIGDFRALQPLIEAEEAMDRWEAGAYRTLRTFLGEEVASSTFAVHRTTRRSFRGDLRQRLALLKERLRDQSAAVRAVMDQLPAGSVSTSTEPTARFAELRQVRLVERDLLDSYVRRMSRTRTRVQISDAIGASKELVEACHRAVLDRLEITYSRDDFAKLGRTVRKEVLRRSGAAPSASAANAIDQIFSGFGSVESALATLRNELGTGHGRTALPEGLRPRHAQLAVDVAEAHIRYLVATLVDLNLL